MLASMTGYGKASGETEVYDIEVEVKSVNHRFTDINLKLPMFLQFKDLELRKIIKNTVSRGSVSVYINLNKKSGSENIQKINEVVVSSYVEMFQKIGQKIGLNSLNWDNIIQLPGVFEKNSTGLIAEDTGLKVAEILQEALVNLKEYRNNEGENLKDNLNEHLNKIAETVSEVKKEAKDAVKIQFSKLQERLSALTDLDSFNKERLEQELVIISDKVDIAEETSRLDSHLKLFKETMELNIPVGQKLNFLAQEMHREANTISAKTNLTKISHYSVTLREIIEKIREQVQNIE